MVACQICNRYRIDDEQSHAGHQICRNCWKKNKWCPLCPPKPRKTIIPVCKSRKPVLKEKQIVEEVIPLKIVSKNGLEWCKDPFPD